MMTKAVLIFGALLVMGVGMLVSGLWGPRARARKRLDRGQTVIQDGSVVTITGVVRPVGELLIAPLSGKPCVLYEATGRVFGKGGNPTVLVADIGEARMTAFELETADGVVRVEGDRAETDIPTLVLFPRQLDREQAFMVAHDQSPQYLRHSSFHEVRVEPGTKIRVQGMAIVELDASAPEGGYRDGARRVKLVAHEQHPLTIGRSR